MRIGTRQLRPDTAAWLKGGLESGVCTRGSLATELCARENWRNPLGAPCLSSARTALPKLAAKLGLVLPEARPMAAATRGVEGGSAGLSGPGTGLRARRPRPGGGGPRRRLRQAARALDDGDAPSGGRRGVPGRANLKLDRLRALRPTHLSRTGRFRVQCYRVMAGSESPLFLRAKFWHRAS